MSQQETNTIYDIVILGASGFTGKYVLKEALKFLNTPSSPLETLAIAGRNPRKLAETLEWASHPSPPPHIPIIVADTADTASLRVLCAQTKLLVNCVGPYRLHGGPVVAAAVAAGIDYLDVCGEPEFMERTEALHGKEAAETGSLVVSACGFDSVPAELGLFFNSRQWDEAAAVNRVEAYVALESKKRMAGNFGTFESAVLGVANSDKLQEFRRSRPKRARPSIPGPPPSKGSLIERHKKLGLWAVILPSADSTVVRRTFSTLTENPNGLPGLNETPGQVKRRESFWSTIKPAHFGVKMGTKSFLGLLRFIILGMLLGVLGQTALGRWLLLNYPSFFSLGWFRKTGPTEEEVRSASFKMWFIGYGFSKYDGEKVKPDVEIITRITGPEVGYATTPIILLQCALIVLKERESLPKGGVFTPGIVFGPTNLQEQLQQNGISFDFISKTNLSA